MRRHWPLWAAIGVLWATLALVAGIVMQANDGYLTYALDDAYIHAAIARNFAEHGVWGITRHEWSSSASSLLWPLLVAGLFKLVGVQESVPLFLNLLAATGLLVLAYVLLQRFEPAPTPVRLVVRGAGSAWAQGRSLGTRRGWFQGARFGLLLALLFLVPLPALVFSGMEHLLQSVVVLAFFVLAAQVLASSPGGNSARWLTPERGLLLLAPLLTLVRYEGLFLVGAAALLLLVRRRWLLAGALVGLALLPVALYGALSVAKGWYWLPNPVVVKGATSLHTVGDALKLLLGYPAVMKLLEQKSVHVLPLLVLLFATLLLAFLRFDRRRGLWEVGQTMVLLFALTLYAHLLLARVGIFYRYDAYLMAMGLFTIAWHLLDEAFVRRQGEEITLEATLLPRYALGALLLLVPLLFVGSRGAAALAKAPRAPINIYEQQIQMGRFVRQYYQGERVAANDIGAINYFADIHCLDLMGLGSREVAQQIRAGSYNTAAIASLVAEQESTIAIVYDEWFGWENPTAIPEGWVKVGSWTIANNVVAGDDTVTFYATTPAGAPRLAANLRDFASQLPDTVHQAGSYLENAALDE